MILGLDGSTASKKSAIVNPAAHLVMNYTKFTKTIVTFDNKGNDSIKTSYTDSTGSLTIKNGTITLKDNKEIAGEDVKLEKD